MFYFCALRAKHLLPIALALLVIPLGLEPKTYSLEGCCSIQLSYGTNRHTQPIHSPFANLYKDLRFSRQTVQRPAFSTIRTSNGIRTCSVCSAFFRTTPKGRRGLKFCAVHLEPKSGLEPETFSLRVKCSTD